MRDIVEGAGDLSYASLADPFLIPGGAPLQYAINEEKSNEDPRELGHQIGAEGIDQLFNAIKAALT